MDKIFELLKGRKTFIVAITIAVLGLLQGLEVFVVPEWVWPVIGGLGLTFLRAGVNKVSDAVKP